MNTVPVKIVVPAISAAELAVNPRTHRVYVGIDWATGKMWLAEKHQSEWGTMTFSQLHGHDALFAIANGDKARALRDFLATEIAPLVERVVAGYERHWNGSNHVARLSDDADVASQRIGDLFDIRAERIAIK